MCTYMCTRDRNRNWFSSVSPTERDEETFRSTLNACQNCIFVLEMCSSSMSKRQVILITCNNFCDKRRAHVTCRIQNQKISTLGNLPHLSKKKIQFYLTTHISRLHKKKFFYSKNRHDHLSNVADVLNVLWYETEYWNPSVFNRPQLLPHY